MATQLFVDLILPLPLPKLFTYEIPEYLHESAKKGKRVVVQFGKKKLYTAVIFCIHNHKPVDYETKNIIDIIDQEPIISERQLDFWQWIATYYMCSLGDVYKAALPSGLKLESETLVYANQNFDKFDSLNSKEELVFRALEENVSLKVSDLNALFENASSLSTLKSLQDKKAIFLEEQLRDNYKPKFETYISLHAEINNEETIKNAFDKLNRAPKQQDILMAYLHLSKFYSSKDIVTVRKNDLLQSSLSDSQTLKSLIKKNILTEYDVEIGRIDTRKIHTQDIKPLTAPQQDAFYNIKAAFDIKNVVLLHGVTSSGKTEIYIHLIQEIISQKKQVLYLLPEIALTTQIINRLKNVFGNKVGVYHSKFNDSERVEIWNNVLKNDESSYDIILGVRSSIFLPFSKLGLIIVDEEHENTYKQFDPSPRYNAKDSAIVLASLHHAKVLFGTATPSFETYFNAKSDKFAYVELAQRYQNIKMPEIIISDIKDARKRKKMKSHFSELLLEQIGETLQNKEQVILFQNRRGFSPYIECEVCNWIPKCVHCDVNLTYHKSTNQMVCHYCGYTHQPFNTCKACGSTSLSTRGFGTEKIEDEIAIFFPEAKVARMDLDSTRSRKSYEKIISEFETKQVDILIGTQMVTKGLDFDNVSLVGVLNADNMLNFPDFRAFERSFQLMVQVSGRAGRKNKEGKVIIQTSDPSHLVIKDIISNDYNHLFINQLKERKQFNYPPYFKLINLTIKHKDIKILNLASKSLASELKSKLKKNVLGPFEPIINRIQNYYLKNILIKLPKDVYLQNNKDLIFEQIIKIKSHNNFKNIDVNIDVDPM
ncbi:MAG TPA: primosomal protein N' [Bacteroidales bacterium]|nr:MAG: primosomal protein N' [Bacteroidetes bacterium GWF2_33_38]OFY74572.1 MAG: primosomal protein N' [Bacteroidetes bacterium RIFOXYA12_FULL_33_9]OFY89365.1 MAG: primosomal protein N' [Bacteroidetes bacterium RIFOXYA2_FULL_33_7]HBF88092.1 primosomal protein N' [Bacteroidales bacterium]